MEADDGRPEGLEKLFSGRAPEAAMTAQEAREKKSRIQGFYDKINDSLSESVYADDAIFFNYGFLPDGRPRSAKIELPERWPNRNRMDLVLELLGDCDLDDLDILDVGCGRGGTILTIDRYFTPGGSGASTCRPAPYGSAGGASRAPTATSSKASPSTCRSSTGSSTW